LPVNGISTRSPTALKEILADQEGNGRRREFQDKFKLDYDTFCALPLGTARHISEHRTGVAPVTVTVTGRFGVTYRGSPTKDLTPSETRAMPPELGWMQKHLPLRPMWMDFDIDGNLCLRSFVTILNARELLISRARILAEVVHRSGQLTSPPYEM
jgi:hypothetical protein